MYKLEKNIPLPKKAGRKKKLLSDFTLPLLKMTKIDSFLIHEPATEVNLKKYKNILRRFCITCKSEINESRSYFVDAWQDPKDKTIKGIRIWRKK